MNISMIPVDRDCHCTMDTIVAIAGGLRTASTFMRLFNVFQILNFILPKIWSHCPDDAEEPQCFMADGDRI